MIGMYFGDKCRGGECVKWSSILLNAKSISSSNRTVPTVWLRDFPITRYICVREEYCYISLLVL